MCNMHVFTRVWLSMFAVFRLYFVELDQATSIEQFQQKLKEHASLHTNLSWIIGTKWEQDVLGRYPTRYSWPIFRKLRNPA